MKHRLLGDILVEEGLLTREDLYSVLANRSDTSEPLGVLLVRQGLITEKDKTRCIGKQHGVPFVDLAETEIEPETARLISHTSALRFKAIPISKDADTISVAMANPLDVTAIDEFYLQTGLKVEPIIAVEDEIIEAILRCFGVGDDVAEIIGEAIKDVEVDDFKVAQEEEKDTEVSESLLSSS